LKKEQKSYSLSIAKLKVELTKTTTHYKELTKLTLSVIKVSLKLTPEQQQDVEKIQSLGNNLQSFLNHKQALEAQLRDNERALKATEKLEADAVVYRMAGAIMYRSDVETTNTSLSDTVETLNIQINNYSKMIESSQKEYKELETKLQESLQQPM
jgi:prefoldin beta subunit